MYTVSFFLPVVNDYYQDSQRVRIARSCVRNAEKVVRDVQASDQLPVEVLKYIVALTKSAQPVFVPYVCMPNVGGGPIWQSEFLFGPDGNLSLVPHTINSTWAYSERDFFWDYRLFIFQAQLMIFKAIKDDGIQKRLLNNSNDFNKFTPVCYNPVPTLHDITIVDTLSSKSFDSSALLADLNANLDGMRRKLTEKHFNEHSKGAIAQSKYSIC